MAEGATMGRLNFDVRVLIPIVVFLIAAFAVMERKAVYCGNGWVASMNLPFGIQADRTNGDFTFKDPEGFWIVLFPLSELQTTEGEQVVVARVWRYAYDSNLYVEILAKDKKRYFVVIDDPDFLNQPLTAYTSQEFENIRGSKQPGAMNWINVDAQSCWNNTFTLWRIFCLLAVGMLLLSAFREKGRKV